VEPRSFLLPGATALVVALVLPATAIGAGGTTGQARVAAGVVREINVFRVSRGLPRLRVNGELVAAARAHSLEMTTLGYFSHHSADGAAFWQRVRRWYSIRSSWSTGENLLWRRPRIGGMRVVQLWLASPPHRHNIVDPDWHDVGCSAVHASSAPGVFADEPVTVVTCDFGARS
jgi:uncharacterized protein YkwD